MPNPRDTMETNTKRLALIMEADPRIKEIFDRRMNSDICKIVAEDEDSGVQLTGCFQYLPVINSVRFPNTIVKIEPPNFLNESQNEFYINRFPLKGKNE